MSWATYLIGGVIMTKEERFIIARWAYAIGKDFISDIEYDNLERELKEKGVLNEYTSRGWSEDPCPYELLKKEGLDEFITSVVFSHQTESIESLNTKDSLIQRCGNVKNEKTRCSLKVDGFNIRLNYYNGKFVSAQTRNRNAGVARDLYGISDLFPKTIPLDGKVLIVGELFLKSSTFEKYKSIRNIVSQRSGVSSAIANNDSEFLGCVFYSIYSDKFTITNKFDNYDYIKKCGLQTPMFVYCSTFDDVVKSIDVLGRKSSIVNYPTDGVVLENSTMQYAIRLGKWKEEVNSSKITGYVINHGIYGNNILVSVEPVIVNGRTISEIDVDNIQTIIDHNLKIGSVIAFTERSSANAIFDATKTTELRCSYGCNN